MPTPVSSVRQCFTQDAAAALDDAVSVARRRSHAQTTSLHAVSALLALPCSSLREACALARSPVCMPRLQFRALELSVGVSLDRLPSSKTVEDPPVSNSLMAAVKRSQAMQKRHPECFPAQNQTTSISGVKVELKHFILSILDDPVVSKVLGEAGFKSYDIKLAILNPPSRIPLFSRSRCSSSHVLGGGFSGFRFTGVEEDYRRIREIMEKKKGRNPMLIGPCAGEALCGFLASGESSGLKVVCLKKDVFQIVLGGRMEEEKVGLRFQELGCLVKSCSGVVVNIGEVGEFLEGWRGEEGDGVMGYAVEKLSEMVGGGGRLWLIAAAENHKTYSMFQSRFPLIETEWDLQLLPITSFRSSPSSCSAARGCYPKTSLMGSFVPFGGFFPMPSDIGSPFGIVESGNPVSDVPSSGLSSWLQMVEQARDSGNGIKMNNGGMKSLIGMVSPTNETIEQPLSVFSMDRTGITDPSSSEGICTVSGRCVLPDMYNSKSPSKISKTDDSPHPDSHKNAPFSYSFNLPSIHPSISNVIPVTTDLHLGTISPASIPSLSCGNQWQCPTDPNSLCKQLMGKVGRQEDALRAISETICLHKSRRQGYTSRGGVWIGLLGPDRPAKKSIASALAEIIFSTRLSFISLDMISLQGIGRPNSEMGVSNPSSRGKTAVDYISEELKKCRNSVIFVENIDQGDLLVQNSLSYAVRTGKFPDSHGREVDVSDMIFIATMNTRKPNTGVTKLCEFTEDAISQVEFRQLQITVETGSERKRKRKKARSELDLNLPVQEEEVTWEEDECKSSEKWVKFLEDEADISVVLERVDLDEIAEDLWGEIEGSFKKNVGGRGVAMEVGEGAMGQLVAAAWRMREGRVGVKEWIYTVLSKSFEEAGRKYGVSLGYIFRLVQGEELLCREDEAEAEASETCHCLPHCILLN